MFLYEASAKVYALNEFITLENGMTYKSYAISPFTLDFCKVARFFDEIKEQKSLYIYQKFCGRFLKYVNNTFYCDLSVSIPEKVKNVQININGENYYTDQNGTINISAPIQPIKPFITYKTPSKQNNTFTCEIGIDTPIVLKKVIKSLSLPESYTVYEGEDYEFFGKVNYYGNDSENIKVFTDDFPIDGYHVLAKFYHNDYNLEGKTCDIYYYRQKISDYKNGFNGLIGGDFYKDDVERIYNMLIDLTDDLTYCEYVFVIGEISDCLNFNYAVDFYVSDITYGDEQKECTVLNIDGSYYTNTVSLYDYNYCNGDITVKAKFIGQYLGMEYTLEKSIGGVLAAPLTYYTDQKEGVYLDSIKPLTGTITEGSLKFDDDLSIITLFTNATQQSCAGVYAIWGQCLSPYYKVTFVINTYTIKKKEVFVAIYDKTVSKDKAANIRFEIMCEENPVIGYNVYKDGQIAAIIDLYGDLSQDLAVGEYFVKPIFDEQNYIVNAITVKLTILPSCNKYSVGFGFTNGQKTEFCGKEFEFEVKVTDLTNGSLLDKSRFSVQIFKDGNEVDKIYDTGFYTVTVLVDDKNYSANIIILPCKLKVAFADKSIYYGDLPGEFIYTAQPENAALNFTIPDDIIKFSVSGKKVSAISIDENFVVASLEGQFTLLKRPIEVEIESLYKFYGDFERDFTLKLKSGSLIEGDTLSKIIKLDRQKGENVGTYKITPCFIDEKYQVTVNEAYLIIAPMPIEVVSPPINIFYGEDYTVQFLLVSGRLKAGENINEIVSIDYGSNLSVNKYQPKISIHNQNYQVTARCGDLTVMPLEIILSIKDCGKIYGNSDEYWILCDKTLAYGQHIEEVITFVREDGENVGVYKYCAKVKSSNYKVTFDYEYGDYSLYTIDKRPVTLTASDTSFELGCDYDTIISGLSFTVDSGNEAFASELKTSYAIISSGEEVFEFSDPQKIGEYEILPACDNKNFDITFVSGKLSITKKKIYILQAENQFTFSGESLCLFDYTVNLTDTGGLADKDSFYINIYIVDNGDYIKTLTAQNAGNYYVEVLVKDSHIFELAGDCGYYVTVDKLDLSSDINIDFVTGDFLVIGDDLPTISVNGYEPCMDIGFYLEDEKVSLIERQGTYKVTVKIIDNNLCGEKTIYFDAYFSCEKKIESIKQCIDDFLADKDLQTLLDLREFVLDLSYGDLKQIENISAYKPVIEQFKEVYTEYCLQKQQNFDAVCNKLFHNSTAHVPFAFTAFIYLLIAVLKGIKL